MLTHVLNFSFCPVGAVEVAVADGFGQVGRPDVGAAVEVGNGAGHAEDAVVGAGREVEALHGRVQALLAGVVHDGMFADEGARHLCVAVDARVGSVALGLNLPCPYHPFADGSARLFGLVVGHFLERYGSYLHLKVYTVEDYIHR